MIDVFISLDIHHKRCQWQEGLFAAEFAKWRDFGIDSAAKTIYTTRVRVPVVAEPLCTRGHGADCDGVARAGSHWHAEPLPCGQHFHPPARLQFDPTTGRSNVTNAEDKIALCDNF